MQQNTFRVVYLISIHALLAESDRSWVSSWTENANFYPRSPCGERHCRPASWNQSAFYFYPRSPCGERPNRAMTAMSCWIFLSTLSLRRATFVKLLYIYKEGISIHALLAESDCQKRRTDHSCDKFLSTLSLRRATARPPAWSCRCPHFYPRSPCGERLGADKPNQ